MTFRTFTTLMRDALASLDVVRVEPMFVWDTDHATFRFHLRDGRRLDAKVSGPSMRTAHMLQDMLMHEVHGRLVEAYRRCMDHDDCREVRELGEACWRDTYAAR